MSFQNRNLMFVHLLLTVFDFTVCGIQTFLQAFWCFSFALDQSTFQLVNRWWHHKYQDWIQIRCSHLFYTFNFDIEHTHFTNSLNISDGLFTVAIAKNRKIFNRWLYGQTGFLVIKINSPCAIHVATEFGWFQKFAPFNCRFHLITLNKMIMYSVFFTRTWFSRCMRYTANFIHWNHLFTIDEYHWIPNEIDVLTWNQMFRGIQQTNASIKYFCPSLQNVLGGKSNKKLN